MGTWQSQRKQILRILEPTVGDVTLLCTAEDDSGQRPTWRPWNTCCHEEGAVTKYGDSEGCCHGEGGGHEQMYMCMQSIWFVHLCHLKISSHRKKHFWQLFQKHTSEWYTGVYSMTNRKFNHICFQIPILVKCRWRNWPAPCFCGRLRSMSKRRKYMRWGAGMRHWWPICCPNMWLDTSWAPRKEMRWDPYIHRHQISPGELCGCVCERNVCNVISSCFWVWSLFSSTAKMFRESQDVLWTHVSQQCFLSSALTTAVVYKLVTLFLSY